MRLGIVVYGTLAQIVIYHDATKPIKIMATFTDRSGEQQTKSIERKAVYALISEPMLQHDILLRAELNGEIQGETRGYFVSGTLRLTERSGIFSKVNPRIITEREVLRVFPIEDCPGLDRTEIALLSKKWTGDQMRVSAADTYWWSNDGLRHLDEPFKRGITGYSTEEGGVVCDCHAALVAVLSGPYMGKTGWLAWGGNAGLAISGGYGKITAAVWYPHLLSFPHKVQGIVILPPESIAKRSANPRGTGQNTDGIAMY